MRGDTLISIARRFGITPWWKLGEINGLKEPYKIEVGQVLKLK
ncbi:MAG: LysM peptidoglycan-binding domain-containing protein [Chloroflexi bacterium]|nr:LysM peptidoglycan-binding domain-containing protein [Chloroflexota bacterium]